jgi:hypothetical protein
MVTRSTASSGLFGLVPTSEIIPTRSSAAKERDTFGCGRDASLQSSMTL